MVVDGAWIALSLLRVCWCLLSVSQLDAGAMALLLGEPVTSVRADAVKGAVKAVQSEKALIGAGGTGTSRSWLTVELCSGQVRRIFVEPPAATLFEGRVGVYSHCVWSGSRALGSRLRPRPCGGGVRGWWWEESRTNPPSPL